MENSSETLSTKICNKCGATWVNGKHYWRTGNTSDHSELDLAGLVCNDFGDEQCINPSRGMGGGDTWKKRSERITTLEEED